MQHLLGSERFAKRGTMIWLTMNQYEWMNGGTGGIINGGMAWCPEARAHAVHQSCKTWGVPSLLCTRP